MTPDQRDTVLDEDIVIVGKKGSGKTYTGKGFVEHLLERGRRVCIVDPTGVWWGLRSSADGRRPGFPVTVLGGDHADVPIGEDAGARVGELVAGRNLPCIVDTSEFGMGERQRFMTEFAGALMKHNRAALHLILDEADEVAPQQPLPETRRLLNAIDRIVRRGRVRGFRVMMITQRPAVLHKNVMTQVGTLVAMKLPAPQDRDAILGWVEANADRDKAKEILASLPQLEPGEGWIWSPGIGLLERTRFPRIRTFDSSRTPEHGENPEPEERAAIDVGELGELLAPADAIADGKGKRAGADDSKRVISAELPRLQERIAKLEREVAEGEAAIAELVAENDRWQGLVQTIEAAIAEFFARRPAEARPPPAAAEPAAPAPTPPAIPRSETSGRKPNGSDPSVGVPLGAGHRKILTVLAQHPAGRTRQQLAIQAGYAIGGGGFRNLLSELRVRGLLTGTGDEPLRITPAGLAALGPVEPLPTGPALVDWWCGQLEKAPRLILRHLVASYPDAVGKREVAEATGYESNGGGFRNALSKLRVLKLAHGSAKLRAADEFFNEGGRA